jgi:hypothetical protein
MATAGNGGTKAQTPGGLVYSGGGIAQRHDFLGQCKNGTRF